MKIFFFYKTMMKPTFLGIAMRECEKADDTENESYEAAH